MGVYCDPADRPDLSAEIVKLKAELEVAHQEAAEAKQSFSLRWNADMRAIKRWQKAHPGMADTWPDHADMCVWLMGELDRKVKEYSRYRWRPIAELHEDYGPCVLMNIDDPGYLEVGLNVNTDYDESMWTHFTQITPLSSEEGERMKAEVEARKGLEEAGGEKGSGE